MTEKTIVSYFNTLLIMGFPVDKTKYFILKIVQEGTKKFTRDPGLINYTKTEFRKYLVDNGLSFYSSPLRYKN